jgi:hypothetical protein
MLLVFFKIFELKVKKKKNNMVNMNKNIIIKINFT